MCTKAAGVEGRGVSQGNHSQDTVFAVISLNIFRERVGEEECRRKQCNENGSNNAAGQSS